MTFVVNVAQIVLALLVAALLAIISIPVAIGARIVQGVWN